MKVLSLITLIGSLFFTSAIALADDDRPDHFKGLPANTLEQALANLNAYNEKLQAALTGELGAETMGEIHVLSYTLENALLKIEKEVDELKDTLEEVHQASEHMKTDKVKQQGNKYLNTSAKLFGAN